MLDNKSGRVLTIFLVIAAVLLASLAAIAVFFFQIEITQRKAAEKSLEEMTAKTTELDKQVADFQKQVFLLQDKNKEADERINGLLDEVDMQKGLKEELKTEATTLRGQLDVETKAKDKLKEQLAQATQEYQVKIKELEAKVQAQSQLPVAINEPQPVIEAPAEGEGIVTSQIISRAPDSDAATPPAAPAKSPVDLDKIVVVPEETPQGRVLSVDLDTEFLIVNLGKKDGVEQDQIMSVYRGKDYLGDVKVTRVQDEMSAADFIPPFSSRQVRKNDEVVAK